MKEDTSLALVNVISTAIQVPGVKVSRDEFLREQFRKKTVEEIQQIIEEGPVQAGCSQKELRKMAQRLVTERTVFSSGASFVSGLPGGIAMAATIPADVIQFYGVALRLAQELAYLYGEPDLWLGEKPDNEKVTNQLILYCGVMLGATGAAQVVRILSSSLAEQALKKLPQKALTKVFFYRVIQSIAKFFGAKMTKDVFAKGVSKAVPIVGGVISGGVTLATMKPMGMRLADTFDEAHFAYSEEAFAEDVREIVKEYSEGEEIQPDSPVYTGEEKKKGISSSGDVFEEINKAKSLKEDGIISEEEFTAIKEKLIAKI